MGRFDPGVGQEIQPRHILLVMALAARKFRDEPIRAYWAELASGLGVRPDTVRKWAYEARDGGLLRIQSAQRVAGETPERAQRVRHHALRRTRREGV